MDDLADFPTRGVVLWPVGTGDSSTVVVNDQLVLQVDLHDLAKAQSEENPEVAVVDRLVEALPLLDGKPYLAVFALTHADKDHCLGFADLLSRVHIGEIWSTPRLWREYEDNPDGEALCPDAVAFKEESERRIKAIKKAVKDDKAPVSGDRIKVIGYDDHHSAHAYDELPKEYLAWPGHSITVLDGTDASDHFEAFIHAPFKEDAAAARNETSLAMQVTLTDETGIAGKVLLFGDLAHDTIMKIFNYSEYKKRTEYLEWDLLLAPHHCSKRVMYKKDAEGREELQVDVMNAFERHARASAVIVSSSNAVPDVDTDGANPPHRMAWNRYVETVESADHAICTMTLLDDEAPAPVIFGVDADGARIVTQHLETKSLVEAALSHSSASPSRRLAAVAAAAATVAAALGSTGSTTEVPKSGPERIDEAITADRGGQQAPQTAVGFGR